MQSPIAAVDTKPKWAEDERMLNKSMPVDYQATTFHLPADCLLEILQYLPFEEQIRVGRVAREFRWISRIIASRTKSLDLGDVASGKLASMTPFSLKSFLDLCWGNLERVNFQGCYYIECAPLLEVIADYSFPRLTSLEIKIYCTNDPVDSVIFSHLILKNPMLKRFMWSVDGRRASVFPDGIFPDLESLELFECDDATFDSLIGRVPNLKSFRADYCKVHFERIIDAFLFTTTKLKELHLPQYLERSDARHV